MTSIYTYSAARQNLAALLEKAIQEGEVKIKRKDGVIFVVRPEAEPASPLSVEGLNLGVSTDEIVALIREGRSRYDNQ